MTLQRPTEDELRKRIKEHLNAMPENDGVVIAWLGYLFALAEWGLLDLHTHGRLIKLLPQGIGVKETEIMMVGIEEDQ